MPSHPDIAAVAAMPRDPAWVSILLSVFGFVVVSGTIVFLFYMWKSGGGRDKRR